MSFPPSSHGQTPELADSGSIPAAPSFSFSRETISFQAPDAEDAAATIDLPEPVEVDDSPLPVIRPAAPMQPKTVTTPMPEAVPAPPEAPEAPMPLPTVIPATPLTPAQPIVQPGTARAEKCLTDENWTIIISPQVRHKRPAGPNGIDLDEYDRIYRSIPFRRSEYLANPSYRHDATMEILTGIPRPTVINRHDTPQRHVSHPQVSAPTTPPGLIFRPYRTSRSADFRFLNPYAPYAP